MRKLHEHRGEISHSSRSDLQKEIVAYKQLLEEYTITFSDLTNSSPKKADIRQEAINVAKKISENNHLMTFLLEKKRLPVKDLQKFVWVSHKTLSKYEKYIIALTLIFIGDFTLIKEYINPRTRSLV